MPPQPEPRRVLDDVVELVQLVELADVVFHEERARRIEWAEEDPRLAELPSYDNSLAIAAVEGSITFRFRMIFTDKQAEYISDVAIDYSLPENTGVDRPTQLEFAERVAFMAVYPYLRASISASAARLGQPIPILGIVRQGDFQAGDEMPEDAVREAFEDNASEKSR